ncbi:NFX1-type zinc finger-containing protein 1-like [Cloeon dipterum]|uniref:NFX1-type zinc finger-containing protein 1-like n=1 Tax=Cloeon dipterum TaxID=197152 RepID=UPI00321F99A1
MDLNTFRTFSTQPTYGELVLGKRIKPQPNIVKGSYDSVEHYLSTQFWLLRDDFVSPLRKGVQEYIKCSNKSEKFASSEIKICSRINFQPAAHNGVQICFATEDKDNKFEDSKLLMQGSLVCFTCNNFDTLLFATISGSGNKNCQQVLVKFSERCEENIFANEYICIEAKAFFEHYNHVLKALQEIKTNDFPFPQYFIRVSDEHCLPLYLRCQASMVSMKGITGDLKFDLLKLRSWPSAAHLGLDDHQLVALQAALTSELALIRGAPGTGKTLVGLKIAKILTENKEAQNRKTPILVVSNTNFALDQFLVQALKFTKKLVRIGHSKQLKLDAFNFNRFKGSMPQRLNQLSRQDIIGTTTTIAAKMRSDLACEVVIVEDAAAVTEAHVIACLTNKCQHLILIGDENQLRPTLENNELEALKLDTSLFERMLLNNRKCSTLNVQYRMATEMTKLISPLIYKDLTSSERVLGLPKLHCFTKRVSFVSHNFTELREFRNPSLSRKNPYEAEFVVSLSKYLLLHKVLRSDDITILSTYSDQVSLIKKLMKQEDSAISRRLLDIKVVTVDDYQGGECNVVLLSLVRSNHQGDIGFLAKTNRISVALSKAMHVLVIVGSMDTLSKKCGSWNTIKECLKQQGALDRCLTLRCPVHPENQFAVKQSSEFGQMCPKCNNNPTEPRQEETEEPPAEHCSEVLQCGHRCNGRDQMHASHLSRCRRPCGKRLNCGHVCLKKCHYHRLDGSHQDVTCEQIVTKVRSCGHRVGMLCGEDVETIRCNKQCTKQMRCGHSCRKKCYKTCDAICRQCEVVACCVII